MAAPAANPSHPASSPAPVRLRITFSGAVQGVGFRAHVLEVVERTNRTRGTETSPANTSGSPFGVTGWVKNEPDGTVLAEMQGPATLIELVINAILSARGKSIHGIDRTPLAPIRDENSFVIRR